MPRGASLAGFIRTIVLSYLATATDLSGTGAVDPVVGPVTPGFAGELESWYFTPRTTLTGGPQTFNLYVGSTLVSALVVTAAAAKGLRIQGAAFTEGNRTILDASTLTIKRAASGTSISAGDGQFTVVLRQRLQARS